MATTKTLVLFRGQKRFNVTQQGLNDDDDDSGSESPTPKSANVAFVFIEHVQSNATDNVIELAFYNCDSKSEFPRLYLMKKELLDFVEAEKKGKMEETASAPAPASTPLSPGKTPGVLVPTAGPEDALLSPRDLQNVATQKLIESLALEVQTLHTPRALAHFTSPRPDDATSTSDSVTDSSVAAPGHFSPLANNSAHSEKTPSSKLAVGALKMRINQLGEFGNVLLQCPKKPPYITPYEMGAVDRGLLPSSKISADAVGGGAPSPAPSPAAAGGGVNAVPRRSTDTTPVAPAAGTGAGAGAIDIAGPTPMFDLTEEMAGTMDLIAGDLTKTVVTQFSNDILEDAVQSIVDDALSVPRRGGHPINMDKLAEDMKKQQTS